MLASKLAGPPKPAAFPAHYKNVMHRVNINIKLAIFCMLLIAGVTTSEEVEMVEVPLEKAKECAEIYKYLEYEKNRSDIQMLSLVLSIENSLENGETEVLKKFSNTMLKQGKSILKEIIESEYSNEAQIREARELLSKIK